MSEIEVFGFVSGLFQRNRKYQHGKAVIASQRLAHVFGKPQTIAKAAKAARLRKSRNASRNPIHPSYSTLIAWLWRAAVFGVFVDVVTLV